MGDWWVNCTAGVESCFSKDTVSREGGPLWPNNQGRVYIRIRSEDPERRLGKRHGLPGQLVLSR